ncbi:MAG: FAD-dependent oxidoreductase [Candidatus Sericytochromatia bacterium]|nr:FAD-dependent oxidoreductase [Candidatus Sericytochromatia bacterium]
MRIAIVGGGISGLVPAYLLHREHAITVFEANDYVGGHTRTVSLTGKDGPHAVDTGFIVFNDWTYPNFIKLMSRLGVPSQPSPMSFGVASAVSGLEYRASNLDAFFAQRRNLLRPSFYRMIAEIVRFNRASQGLLKGGDDQTTLGQYLRSNDYSDGFIRDFIVPMAAAVWSADPRMIEVFPAKFFVQFFHNHGMLNAFHQPQWQVIQGGSSQYIAPLTRPFADRIRTQAPVVRIERFDDRVMITPQGGEAEPFDQVIIAAHSDQALRMLADPTPAEREVLGTIAYQPNETVLHTDTSVLPTRRKAWAAWNYHVAKDQPDGATLTYNMNLLQSLKATDTYCVTLNRTAAIDRAHIHREFLYHHPVFTPATVVAQRRRREISGVNRTHYAGAYWGYGFHEDGVKSGLAVAAAFGQSL